MNINISRVEFMGYGARITDAGIYFAVEMDFLHQGGIHFYDANEKKLIETIYFNDNLAFGNVYSVLVQGINSKDLLYRYFSDDNEYADPYSSLIEGNAIYGCMTSKKDIYSKVATLTFMESKDIVKNPQIPMSETVLYLAHVRGLTMQDKSVKHKGTFLGLVEKIPYLVDLGITSMVIMPCYEFIECHDKNDLQMTDLLWTYKEALKKESKVNFWGFEEGYYFAPKAGYSFSNDPSSEFKNMIKEFHRNNLEIIMMMFFPDTVSKNIIIDSLRFYVSKYNVDGFRILGNGIDISAIASDPFLKKTKLFFENSDLTHFWNDKNIKYKNLAVYQSMFLDRSRSFLKGDEDQVPFFSFAFRENNKMYSPVRYITDYSGFTLNDLYSYERKHNENNGEDNTDGSNYNFSWNCGIEGPTRKTNINKIRNRQYMNALLLSFLCQGIPQLRAGDEWLDSNEGNNNPWCQDNEIGWVNYKKNSNSKIFYEFTKNLIAFRSRHSILHQPYELKLFDYMSCKLPDISFHGESAFRMNQEPVSREFAVLLCGDYSKQFTGVAEDSIYIIINMHWENKVFALPVKDNVSSWYKLFSSDGTTDISFNESEAELYNEESYNASGRSITLFLLRKSDK